VLLLLYVVCTPIEQISEVMTRSLEERGVALWQEKKINLTWDPEVEGWLTSKVGAGVSTITAIQHPCNMPLSAKHSADASVTVPELHMSE
jgi:hypothetical protein